MLPRIFYARLKQKLVKLRDFKPVPWIRFGFTGSIAFGIIAI